MFANLLKSGWIHAFIMGLLIYPTGTITQKFVAINGDINIIAYTCLCMLSSSLILLIMAGPGKLTKESLKLPHTWIYGLLEMFTLSVGVAIMIYISATEAAALARTTAIFSFILSIIFLSQPTNKFELVGFVILVIGFLYSIELILLPAELKISLVFLIIIKNFLQASKKITAELHKTNRKTKNFKEELRVTGIVMAVSSLLVSLVLATLAYIQDMYDIQIHDQIPTFADFVNFKLFLISIWGGIVVLSILKYFEFYVSKTLGAKYLMAMASLQIIGIYFIEKFLSLFNLIEMKDFSTENFIALGIILAGNITIAMAGFIKNMKFIKNGKISDTLENLEENFINNQVDFKAAKTNLNCILTMFNNDFKKVSKELNIDIEKIVLLTCKDFNDFKLSMQDAQSINNYASLNISLKDKLTRAYNRYYLEQKFDELITSKKDFELYYLDLNKFKPVNDKYGHLVGDKVLIEVANRINSILDEGDSLIRLGGDEFVILKLIKHESFLDKITKIIECPISVDGFNEVINISTSVGILKDTLNYENLSTALDAADKIMYSHKNTK
jgi:diguanylate cyclase (GGDEF)-like protein